jgi:membrane fusion protein, macrolide-specific efflux system
MKKLRSRSKRQREGALIILMIAGVLALSMTGCGQKVKKPMELTQIAKGTIQALVTTTGTVAPYHRLEIKPPISGRIDSVLVAEGDVVKKGQVLAMMSSSDRAALLDAASAKGAAEYRKWADVYKPAPIIAPLNGFIILKSIVPGQTVTNGDSVLSMADTLIVQAQVDETDLGNVSLGQTVDMQLDAYPGKNIKGKVVHIEYDAQVVNNVTIYVVYIMPVSVPAYFRSGMSATVSFITEEKDNVLLVPLRAIKQMGSTTYAFQYDNASKTAKPIQIKVGLQDSNNAELVSGLNEGDTIAVPDKTMLAALAAKTGRGPRGMGNPFQRRTQ